MKAKLITALLGLAAMAAPAMAQTSDEPPPPTPTFKGQTGAPAPKTPSAYKVETVISRLAQPWSFDFLPDGRIILSQFEGTIRIVDPKTGRYTAPLEGVPGVKIVSAEGMHDITLDPDFAHNRYVYFTYFKPPQGEAPGGWPASHFYDDVYAMSVRERRSKDLGSEVAARGRLSADETRLEDVEVILEGGDRRLVFAPDGTLYVTGADRFRFYDSDLDSKQHDFDDPDTRINYSGRVSRINPDGSIPEDNPFLEHSGVPWDTFSYGHRDPEGAAINPETGELWMVEHGPRGGDELNIIRAGRDYGWPVISYGRQYDLKPAGIGKQAKEGMEQPIYYWYPSIAPGGLMFYTGDRFPDWTGDLFVGAMAGQYLAHLEIDGERVVSEEKLLTDLHQRIRTVRQGPDGYVYVSTDSGSILRIVPR